MSSKLHFLVSTSYKKGVKLIKLVKKVSVKGTKNVGKFLNSPYL